MGRDLGHVSMCCQALLGGEEVVRSAHSILRNKLLGVPSGNATTQLLNSAADTEVRFTSRLGRSREWAKNIKFQ